MRLKKYKIGEFVEPYSQRCGISDLIPEQVSGINIDKEFFEPAKQVGEDTSNYKIVPPDYFACNLMHVGRDYALPVAINHSDKDKYVSPAYTIFKLKDENLVLKEYFFILLKSSEKDRYFAFHTDSSIRQGLPWDDFCDIDITLPSIEQQRKYVDVYLALQNNLAAYQSKVEELKLVCDGYIEELRRNFPSKRIGEYIVESNEKNSDNKIKEVRSVSVTKEFKLTNAKVNKNELSNYLIVHPREIAFVQTTGNEKVLAFAYNDQDYPVVVSSVDKVFKSKDENILDLQFLSLYMSRKEFDRYARFNSWGSAREVFTMDDMNDVEIPIPDISVQREIVNIHKCYIERKRINEQLKALIKDICPILIKGSIEEGRKK